MKKMEYEIHGGKELISFQNFAKTNDIENHNTSGFAKDKEPGLPHYKIGNSCYFMRRTAEALSRIYDEAESTGLIGPKGRGDKTDPNWTKFVQQRLGRHMWTDEEWKLRKAGRVPVVRTVKGKTKNGTKFCCEPLPAPSQPMAIVRKHRPKTGLKVQPDTLELLVKYGEGLSAGERINRKTTIQMNNLAVKRIQELERSLVSNQ